MSRESIDSSQNITSLIRQGEQTRVIRSHRRKGNMRNRLLSVAVAIVVGSTGVTVAGTSHAQAPSRTAGQVIGATAHQAAAMEIEHRGSTVNRSARVALSRKQKIEKVIKYAMAQRGDRYRWGATGPSRWDCSGLVMVAFKKGAGKKLPHFTGGMQKKGTKVSKKNLKRGDLIFPQRGHVGIYLGNGKMIHASSGKGKVVVAKVYGFYTARRVI